jgi:hypothetical protein
MLPGIIGVTVPKFELGVQPVSRALNFVSPVADFCYVERMRLLLKDWRNYLSSNLVPVIKNEICLRQIHRNSCLI